jgi:hypothetical protein
VKFQTDVGIHSWQSAKRGLDCEDGSEIILGTFACTTEAPRRRPSPSSAPSSATGLFKGVGAGQSLGTVKVEDATDDSLEEARNADPGGQLERPKKRRQSGGWMSSVACDQRCISKR